MCPGSPAPRHGLGRVAGAERPATAYFSGVTAIRRLKIGLLVFWAVWSTLVFASNLGEGLRQLGAVPAGFPYASGNFGAIREVSRIFDISLLGAALLFAGVIVWDALNVALFWRAVLHRRRMLAGDFRAVDVAFTVSLALWAALMVASEVFLAYRVAGFEQTHREIFSAVLLSFLAIRVLPH